MAHASTRSAPESLSACAAFWMVPAVSMMSSAMTQVRPATSPITFITSAVPSSLRRLSIDGQFRVEALGVGAGALGAAGVGRDDGQLLVGLARQVSR